MDHSDEIAAATPGWFASTVSVLLAALAGGVAVCFVAVATRLSDDFALVLVGMALGLFLRWQGFTGRRAALCAALATALAFAYAQYLLGAVRIAQTLGLPLREALFKSGWELTADIAWGNLHLWNWALLVLAMAAAVVTSLLRWHCGSSQPR
jgi:hypothetical protein